MKRILLLLVLALPFLTNAQSMDEKIKTLSSELADQIVREGAKKVAVASFEYNGCNTAFGKYLAEEITGYMSVSGRKITVVNQKMLESLMVQNQLTAKGLLEAKNDAAKLGQVSGIDALIYGTITTFGEDLKISANVIRMPVLTVFGFGKTSFSLTGSVKDMLPCMEGTPVTGGPSKTPVNDKNSRAPQMPADCETKKICLVCVTNKSLAPVKAKVNYSGYPIIYLQPNEMKCFEPVRIPVKSDHLDIRIRYMNDANSTIRYEGLVTEPCKLYQLTFTP